MKNVNRSRVWSVRVLCLAAAVVAAIAFAFAFEALLRLLVIVVLVGLAALVGMVVWIALEKRR